MNITVYLGSNTPENEKIVEAAKELGAWIGSCKNTLVYGGSKVGLMGILAQSVLDSGGKVIGVEPQFFVDACVQLEGVDELIVTDDMTQRKAKLIELGEAFIAFPGGVGTLEEITEVMSKLALGQLHAPCIFYNVDGFYNDFKSQLIKMNEAGLLTDERLHQTSFANSLDEIKKLI